MRAGLAITQKETIRNRADDHRVQEVQGIRRHERQELQNKTQNKTQKLRIVTFFYGCKKKNIQSIPKQMCRPVYPLNLIMRDINNRSRGLHADSRLEVHMLQL